MWRGQSPSRHAVNQSTFPRSNAFLRNMLPALGIDLSFQDFAAELNSLSPESMLHQKGRS